MKSRSGGRSVASSVLSKPGGPRRGRALGSVAVFSLVAAWLVLLHPLVAFGQSASEQHTVNVPAELTANAASHGEVGVIVQLAPAGDASSNSTNGHKLLADMGEHPAGAHVLNQLGVVAMSASPEQLTGLSHSKLVTRIEPDTLLAPALDKSTPRIGATTAWAAGIRGDGQTVALIDSGVDTTHPALQGKVIYEACFTNGSCPSGAATQSGPGAARPCTLGLACEHGTHVAGIIAGNAGALSGVAPAASLMAIQVFSRSDSPADCGAASTPCPRARTSDVLAALDHVYEVRAQVPRLVAVNMSLSSDTASSNCDTSILAGSINKLRAANIATIVASGNGGASNGLGVPACISSTISVGATYSDRDAVWPLSNVSPALKLLAPGVAINSPAPGGGFSATTGTSAAAPHVAGAWALVAQKLQTQDVGKILDYLQSKGLSIPYPLPDGSVLQKPRIDVSGLANATLSLPPATSTQVGQPPPNACVDCLGVSGDFSGDGKADVFWYGRGRGNYLWTSNGDGTFSTMAYTNAGDGYIPLAGDFNGDRKSDIFWYSVAGGTNWLWTSLGGAQFAGSIAPPIFANMRPFVGDFNGDGFSDIFWYAPGAQTSWIFFGAPNAQFSGLAAPLVGGDYTPVVGDFDGDGRSDVIWFNPVGTDWIWRSLGDTRFSGDLAPQIDGPYTTAAGDFNGDGKADLLWYGGQGTSWLWTAVGGGNFTGVQYPVASDTSYVPFAGDFR
ncbi:MAG: in, partial [Acidimicrobiia bacterium]|nr:in [Acidimicrobiia bacterium]